MEFSYNVDAITKEIVIYGTLADGSPMTHTVKPEEGASFDDVHLLAARTMERLMMENATAVVKENKNLTLL